MASAERLAAAPSSRGRRASSSRATTEAPGARCARGCSPPSPRGAEPACSFPGGRPRPRARARAAERLTTRSPSPCSDAARPPDRAPSTAPRREECAATSSQRTDVVEQRAQWHRRSCASSTRTRWPSSRAAAACRARHQHARGACARATHGPRRGEGAVGGEPRGGVEEAGVVRRRECGARGAPRPRPRWRARLDPRRAHQRRAVLVDQLAERRRRRRRRRGRARAARAARGRPRRAPRRR